jgi:hypothetical protein
MAGFLADAPTLEVAHLMLEVTLREINRRSHY